MAHGSDRYDFFVSYARADNQTGWIAQFVEGIIAEHEAFSGGRRLARFFDTEEIRSGHDWEHRIKHGVAESRAFLAFISPNYFASEWCRKEWSAWIDTEISKHILSEGAHPIYIVEVPDLNQLPGLNRRQMQSVREFYSEGLGALRRNDLRRVLKSLAEDIESKVQRCIGAAESQTTVPPYNRNFTGRLGELLQLRERLKTDQAGVVCGVHGLGGIGKTELAFTYAHAFAGIYPGGRLLIPCDGKANLRDASLALGDFPDFRAAIMDEDRKTPERLFAAIYACLSRRLEEKGHILLVLDNVTSPEILRREETDVLTKLGPKLHLLMTTRLPAPSGECWLTIDELPEDDAISLLEKHKPFAGNKDRETAKEIVRKLGGFAIAVELLGAYLRSHPGSDYAQWGSRLRLPALPDLEAIADDHSAVLRRHNHQRSLTAILTPVVDHLTPAQRTTLEYAALLPPDTIPLPWLKILLFEGSPEVVQPGPLPNDEWTEIVSCLTELSLFRRTSDDWRVRTHRLIQELLSRQMKPARKVQFEERLTTFVNKRASATRAATDWEKSRWELTSVDAVAGLWDVNGHPDARRNLHLAGIGWHQIAEWSRAENRLRRALAICEASSQPNLHNLAASLSGLGQLLEETNRLVEAEPLLRRALAVAEAAFRPDHPELGKHLNNLAVLLLATRRFAEAERLMRRSLAIAEASCHPVEVSIRLNNLAQLFRDTGRPDEAEPLMRRALATEEIASGIDHPNVAIRLNNLAQLLEDTNRQKEAEALMRRALAIDEKSFGPNHPNVARDLNNLSWLLQTSGQLQNAEPLVRRALAIDELSFGPNHPTVARDLNNLAILLKRVGLLVEAEALMRRAVENLLNFMRTTGHEHPNLNAAATNYLDVLLGLKTPRDLIMEKFAPFRPEVDLDLE